MEWSHEKGGGNVWNVIPFSRGPIYVNWVQPASTNPGLELPFYMAANRVQVATAVYCVSAANNCLGEVQESFIWNEIAGNWSERESRSTIRS